MMITFISEKKAIRSNLILCQKEITSASYLPSFLNCELNLS